MLSFKRTFQTHQQAMDVYRTQLSGQHLFVESFEGAPKDTQVQVTLYIAETKQTITLNAYVERSIGKSESIKLAYGHQPGLYLNVPITQEIITPLRAFFIKPQQPAAVSPEIESVPFACLANCTSQQADKEADSCLQIAQSGNLYQLFGMRFATDRKHLRQSYNKIVKSLHPDKHRADFNDELSAKLGDCYQIINEAYAILQHAVLSGIYLEISKLNHKPQGMSLLNYKKLKSDYRLKNANNIHMADELVNKAKTALQNHRKDEALQTLRLALQYDRYHEDARTMISSL